MKKLAGITFLLSILFLPATGAFACGGSVLRDDMFQPDPDAKIEFVRPDPDGSLVLKDAFLQIFVAYHEDRVGALTPFDHIHYGVGLLGEEKAEQGEFTMPDLTGRVEIYLDNPDINGTYEVCAYLARADHTHLSETACSTFVLATSGMRLFLPRNAASSTSSEVPFEFETYGNDVTYVEYSIDGGDIQRLDLSVTELLLPPLTNGTHTIIVKAFNNLDEQLGNTIARTFTVNSALTVQNAKKLKRLIARAKKTFGSTAQEEFLKRAQRLVRKMKKSGGISVENSNLDADSIKRAGRLLRQGGNTGTLKPLRKAIQILKNVLE